MNPDKFNAISPYLDDIAMILEEMLMEDSDNAKRMRYSRMGISKALGADPPFPNSLLPSCQHSPYCGLAPLPAMGKCSCCYEFC